MKKSRKPSKKSWTEAVSEYSALKASLAMPFLSEPLTAEDIIQRLHDITRICASFYPAYIEQGLRLLAQGEDEPGRKKLEQGFKLLLRYVDPKRIQPETDTFLDSLATLWRFDLCQDYAQRLIDIFPHVALFYDYLAHAQAMLGHTEKSLRSIAKALELEPENIHFISNQGWFHLIAGHLEEAELALRRAEDLDPQDGVVQGNLMVLDYLKKHGGAYMDYLLRKADRERLTQLTEDEFWEDADDMAADYNAGRIEALAMATVRQDQLQLSGLSDRITTLKQFLGFVQSLVQEIFLYEDVVFMEIHFKTIMHKFIFKFKDIDQEMVEDIYDALLEFYQFLAERELFEYSQFESFRAEALSLKNQVIEKTIRYNSVRQDRNLSEKEKEALREEIFEGDHFWPFL